MLIERIPGIHTFNLDSDRPQVEALLSDLETKSRWQEAAQASEDRLQHPLTESWRHELAERHVGYLVNAARDCQGDAAVAYLTKARNFALTYQLPTDLPDAELRALRAADALNAERNQSVQAVRSQTNLSVKHQQAIESLKSAHQAELSAYKANAIGVWAKGRYDEWLRFGDALAGLTDNSARHEYQTAQDFARKYSLDGSGAAYRLRQLDTIEEAAKPVELPQGSQGRILGVQDSLVPTVFVADLVLENAPGVMLKNLRTQDVRVVQGGQELKQTALTIALAELTPWNIAVVLDCSLSMGGKPIQEAKTGIEKLLPMLPAKSSIRLYSFSTAVRAHTPWTNDRRSLQTALVPINADGGTALYATLTQVTADMSTITGPKAVILLTDGKDSTSQPIKPELLSTLKSSGIAWHVVGLQSADLDSRTLDAIAVATGGTFLTAARTTELAERLASVSDSLRQEFYRLAILGVDPRLPLSIEIGRDPAIQLKYVPATRTAATN
jgi:uncharacterized protein YegL/uncharacterized protein YdbL (DUF1318 family)